LGLEELLHGVDVSLALVLQGSVEAATLHLECGITGSSLPLEFAGHSLGALSVVIAVPNVFHDLIHLGALVLRRLIGLLARLLDVLIGPGRRSLSAGRQLLIRLLALRAETFVRLLALLR